MLEAICICFSLGVNSKLSGRKVTLLISFWLPTNLPLGSVIKVVLAYLIRFAVRQLKE